VNLISPSFHAFGPVSLVYVVVDQKTGDSRGFGFFNFFQREDAEKAISKAQWIWL
jgi:translation initiation factor 3 subunit G